MMIEQRYEKFKHTEGVLQAAIQSAEQVRKQAAARVEKSRQADQKRVEQLEAELHGSLREELHAIEKQLADENPERGTTVYWTKYYKKLRVTLEDSELQALQARRTEILNELNGINRKPETAEELELQALRVKRYRLTREERLSIDGAVDDLRAAWGEYCQAKSLLRESIEENERMAREIRDTMRNTATTQGYSETLESLYRLTRV